MSKLMPPMLAETTVRDIINRTREATPEEAWILAKWVRKLGWPRPLSGFAPLKNKEADAPKKELGMFTDKTDEYDWKQGTAQPRPQEDVINRMLTAYDRSPVGHAGDHGRAMTAAARVLLDEALAMPTPLEFDAAINATMREHDPKYHPDGSLHQYAMARHLLILRRSRILPESKKELTREELTGMIESNVHSLCQMPMGSDEQDRAADLVVGLIAQLRAVDRGRK